NVTPFVDVLLVLVVVLLVASPFLHRQINIDLPKEQVKERNTKAEERLIISLNKKGALFLGSEEFSEKELYKKVHRWVAAHPGQRVFIRADKSVKYQEVVHLMAKLKEAGANRLGLLVAEK
ncbi:MAG: hypothetical protein A2508_04400, partial [Candidatus Lambdaproteobacteria bacterium RIFOXYD12_FULL_49_8]